MNNIYIFLIRKQTAYTDEEHLQKENESKNQASSSLLKWLHEVPDELDVLIAHRDFDAAVDFVDQGKLLFVLNYCFFDNNLFLKNFEQQDQPYQKSTPAHSNLSKKQQKKEQTHWVDSLAQNQLVQLLQKVKYKIVLSDSYA